VKFKKSKPFTVGIELEVQILDRESFELTPKSKVIFENIKNPNVQKEFLQSMVEFVTGVNESPEEAVEELRESVREVLELGDSENFFLSASGTHPFADPSKIRVTENDRYLKLLEEFQEVLRNFLIYGLHIHVGFPDEERALNAYNLYVKYLPLFLALSASSPFFNGRNTGILSYRTKIFEQLPRAGIPEQFSNYGEFVELYERLKEAGLIESLKDVWWDVRLRPDFGTVELRVCDSVSSFKRIEGLATLAVILGEFSLSKEVHPDFHQIHVQNKWNAARHGLKGKFVKREGTTTVGRELHEIVKEYGKRFGRLKESAKVLLNLISLPTQAELQIEEYRRTKDLKAVVKKSLVKMEE
jgi:carboxylate-amine ligase